MLKTCYKQIFFQLKQRDDVKALAKHSPQNVCIIKFALPFPPFDPFVLFFFTLSLHLCCPSFPPLHLLLFHPFHLCPHMQTHPIHLLCLLPSADNLKGRQLLHTTYKMFMTAAGVEGKRGPDQLAKMQQLASQSQFEAMIFML